MSGVVNLTQATPERETGREQEALAESTEKESVK